MDRQIIWTEKSSSDIEAIVRYIARRDPKAAARIGLGIYERVQILLQHPEAGTVLDELRDSGWRKLIFRRWLFTRSAATTSSLEESGRQRWAKPIWKNRCDALPIQRFNEVL